MSSTLESTAQSIDNSSEHSEVSHGCVVFYIEHQKHWLYVDKAILDVFVNRKDGLLAFLKIADSIEQKCFDQKNNEDMVLEYQHLMDSCCKFYFENQWPLGTYEQIPIQFWPYVFYNENRLYWQLASIGSCWNL